MRALTPERQQYSERMAEAAKEAAKQIQTQERSIAFLQMSALQGNPTANVDWELLERVRQGYAAEKAERLASMSQGERLVLFVLEQLIWGLATVGVGEFLATARPPYPVERALTFVKSKPSAVEQALVEGLEFQTGRLLSPDLRAQLGKAWQDFLPKVEAHLKASASARGAFPHWSQWNRPADNAWQDFLRDLNNAYRATGRVPRVSPAERMHGGQRVWGGFDPVTEQITFYKGWDMSTAFEELLHWEDLPALKNYFLRTPGWDQARWDAAMAARTGADWNNISAVAEQRVHTKMIANGFTPKAP